MAEEESSQSSAAANDAEFVKREYSFGMGKRDKVKTHPWAATLTLS
jgi:hypothetical protein